MAFALTGRWAGARAIAGAAPVRVLAPEEDPFKALDALPALAPGGDEDVLVGGGWFGALGYGLAARVEATVPVPPHHLRLPDAPVALHDWVVVCDADGRWWFEALGTPEREAALERRRAEMAARLLALVGPGPVRLRDTRFRDAGEGGHRAAVEACQARIRAGELFQANLCLHLEATLEGGAPALAATSAEALAPDYGGYLAGSWGAVVSASPELFLRRTGPSVSTEPIKGTAPAGDAGPLESSGKDRAENVMIVDLMRNDLGRVCEFGSVTVDALAAPRPGSGVVHLTSRISGRLRPGVGNAELLDATFPPGSVTGAPKVQALRMISELEGSAREHYTGAIGFSSPVAGLELNVAIRTFEIRGTRVQLGVGGGITAASEAGAELEECRVKARPLLAVGGARIPPARPHAAVRLPFAALSDGRGRPDPARGVFETMLVRRGVVQRCPAHLDRLADGAEQAGVPVPSDITSQIMRRADALGTARLRVELGAGGVRWASGPLPTPGPPVELVACLLPGGLGSAKWADRRLLDALAAAVGATPLLVDGDGAVLEAAWGSVWIEEGGGLLTPPADGRILPGVTRAALLGEDPRCATAPLTLARLRAADGVWLSSALRGLVRARLA